MNGDSGNMLVPVRIIDLREVSGDDRRIDVVPECTGMPLRLRRDAIDFMPGHVLIPLWLKRKVFGAGTKTA
ncbi:MAG: hypothetical protein HKM93_10450 [Desulfobacteraceae bacterium]|nr:hypothetical protein [Desulfobacteraceae bacterium]